MYIINETGQDLYEILGGVGAVSLPRLILLLSYHAGAITLKQLEDLNAGYSTYCNRQLNHLVEQGYLCKHARAIPSPFLGGKASDVYSITEEGSSYVRLSILNPDYPLTIRNRRDESLYSPDHMQLFHNIGIIRLFYAVLPDWDSSHGFYTERGIPGADFRPDAQLIIGNDTLYLEEDTGSQQKAQLQDKFTNYGAYFSKQAALNHVLVFQLSDLRAISNSIRKPMNFANRIKQLDKEWCDTYGTDYHITKDSFPHTLLRFLPSGQSEYSRADIQQAVSAIVTQQDEALNGMVFRNSKYYHKQRRETFLSLTGMESAWMNGLSTVLLPERYNRKYLPAVLPRLFYPQLIGYVERLGFTPSENSIDGTFGVTLTYGDTSITCPVLLNDTSGGWLAIENIYSDLGGRYRAGFLSQSGYVNLLLITDSKDDLENFIRTYPPSDQTGVIYVMYEEDIIRQQPVCYLLHPETMELTPL